MILLTPAQYNALKENNNTNIVKANIDPKNDISDNNIPATASTGVPVSDQVETVVPNDDKVEKVISLLPVNIKNKAKQILSHLLSTKSILSWNDSLQILVSGNIFSKSNIADLLRYVLVTGRTPSFTPNYLLQFLCCLKKSNVPLSMLNNASRKKIQSLNLDDCSISNIKSDLMQDDLKGAGMSNRSYPPPGIKSITDIESNQTKQDFIWTDY